jgi:hypothetical protein
VNQASDDQENRLDRRRCVGIVTLLALLAVTYFWRSPAYSHIPRDLGLA